MSTTTATAAAAPWFGRRREHRHALITGVGSLLACLVYVAAARWLAPDRAPGAVEFAGTATYLWSVWMTQRRNVLALPVGMVSVLLVGWTFLDIGLIGQVWLNWAYYIPVQLWAWLQWTRGGEGGTELPVTRMSNGWRLLTLVAGIGFTALFGWVLNAGWDRALFTYWDASIVAASVVAMLLLSRKKAESWWLWILPVNLSAIGLYASTGAYMFAALYALLLAMAIVGLWRWNTAARNGTP